LFCENKRVDQVCPLAVSKFSILEVAKVVVIGHDSWPQLFQLDEGGKQAKYNLEDSCLRAVKNTTCIPNQNVSGGLD
jgi:hypothetical protein